MTDKSINDCLMLCVEKHGKDRVKRFLNDLIIQENDDRKILTIVSNEGVHHLPEEFSRGEIFVASKGSLDFSSHDIIHRQYEKILSELAIKLKSSTWDKIYIVPFGHATLSMQIKLLVYRIASIETIDIFHVGNGKRIDFELKQRDIIVNTDS